MLVPRPYQLETRDRFFELLAKAEQGVAVESPVGTGKSLIMALVAAQAAKEGGVLILAHREELVRGNARHADELLRSAGLGRCSMELNTESRMTAHDWQDIRNNGGVVSASVDTMQGRRLKAIPSDTFKLLLLDECHHVIPMTKRGMENAHCSKYYKIKLHFNNCKWGGFSGTFYRAGKKDAKGNRKNIMSRVFDQIYRTGSLFQFVDSGWLVDYVPKHLSAVSINLDFSKLKTRHVSEADAMEVWKTHKFEAMSALRQGLHEYCGTRPTLIFSPQVQHASWVAEFINSADPEQYQSMGPDTADYVASYSIDDEGKRCSYPEWRRRSVVDKFNTGRLQWMSNQGVFTEGTDIPPVAAIALCRLTESRNLLRQMVGRGGRVLPGVLDGLENSTAPARLQAIASSAKPNCLLLDFSGVTQRKGVCDLASSMDIFDESANWGEVQRQLAQDYWAMQQKKGNNATLREIKEAVEERTSAWMNSVRAMLKHGQEQVAWEVTEIDFRTQSANPVKATVHRESVTNRPSEKQINYCLSLQRQTGMSSLTADQLRGMTFKQVGAIIDKCKTQRDQLPCPSWLFQQLRQKYGVPVSKIPDSWGGAFEVKRKLDSGSCVDELPRASSLRLFA